MIFYLWRSVPFLDNLFLLERTSICSVHHVFVYLSVSAHWLDSPPQHVRSRFTATRTELGTSLPAGCDMMARDKYWAGPLKVLVSVRGCCRRYLLIISCSTTAVLHGCCCNQCGMADLYGHCHRAWLSHHTSECYPGLIGPIPHLSK